MKTRRKILIIISAIILSYVVIVEVNNYFNGGLHQTSQSQSEDNPNSFIRIDDDTFNRQSLQTGETMGDANGALGWFGLIMSLFIVSTFVIMKIKKSRK